MKGANTGLPERERKARMERRKQKRAEYITTILGNKPYTEESALYQRAKRDLEALCDDVLFLLAANSPRMIREVEPPPPEITGNAPPIELGHNSLVIINGRKGTVGTVKGYAREYREDDKAAREKAMEKHEKLAWVNQEPGMLCGDPGYYEEERKKWKDAIQIEDGDVVMIEGEKWVTHWIGNYATMVEFLLCPPEVKEQKGLTPELKALASAISQDFNKTYPGTPTSMVEEEMRSQINGTPPGKGILGVWIQDYLKRGGYLDEPKGKVELGEDKLRCLGCGWEGDQGSRVEVRHESGGFPGDDEVDLTCPKCGSDEFTSIPPVVKSENT